MNDNDNYIDCIQTPSLYDCNKIFTEYNADIIVYGHNHMSSFIRGNEKMYINCGFLGCPHRFIGEAKGGIITIDDGKVEFELVEKFATSFKTERSSFLECLENLIYDDSVFLCVAETNNKIYGYCFGFDHYTFYANGRVAWLEEIMVNEDYRKCSIGNSLMNEFEKWSKSRNSRLVALATRRAVAFYKSLNYEESAEYFRKLL